MGTPTTRDLGDTVTPRYTRPDERVARQRRIALIVVGAMLLTFVVPFLAIVLL
ncbi:hypothetical protein GCM10025865_21960 [Paraoerskovia sediminicola]|uniref:Uncharacterized protein n=1 Tax=Paraoerskovia sediminicola TaxID=1138587 RepID=A0ABN6XDE8_9CELL|nr:hypothetical protein [Paraoerskovia sediminicola]BDZ42897.1 hypothetical protein GCM10025865_21960 [Paraoerskovia sediminicola]